MPDIVKITRKFWRLIIFLAFPNFNLTEGIV